MPPTSQLRPNIPRPPDLWRAWELTTRYVVRLTQRDTRLVLVWNTQGIDAPWMAQFNWLDNMERVSKLDTPGDALMTLWQRIDAQYTFFQETEEARQAPRSYPPDAWFSSAERTLLDRLLALASAQPDPAITLLITYTESQHDEANVTVRWIDHATAHTLTGSGGTLRTAMQDLYPRVVSADAGK
jgi:hypothetical protein